MNLHIPGRISGRANGGWAAPVTLGRPPIGPSVTPYLSGALPTLALSKDDDVVPETASSILPASSSLSRKKTGGNRAMQGFWPGTMRFSPPGHIVCIEGKPGRPGILARGEAR